MIQSYPRFSLATTKSRSGRIVLASMPGVRAAKAFNIRRPETLISRTSFGRMSSHFQPPNSKIDGDLALLQSHILRSSVSDLPGVWTRNSSKMNSYPSCSDVSRVQTALLMPWHASVYGSAKATTQISKSRAVSGLTWRSRSKAN